MGFSVGQKVYDLLYGIGNVVEIDDKQPLPVFVKFKDDELAYTYEGYSDVDDSGKMYKRLYTDCSLKNILDNAF
jgi:hypothetical protein